MKQILRNLKTGATEVTELPSPRGASGQLLIHTTRTLVSAGTGRADSPTEVAGMREAGSRLTLLLLRGACTGEVHRDFMLGKRRISGIRRWIGTSGCGSGCSDQAATRAFALMPLHGLIFARVFARAC